MNRSLRFSNSGLMAVLLVVTGLSVLGGCGSASNGFGDETDGGTGGGSSGGGGTGDSGLNLGGDGGALSLDGSYGPQGTGSGTAKGTFTAPDCPGCTFPAL